MYLHNSQAHTLRSSIDEAAEFLQRLANLSPSEAEAKTVTTIQNLAQASVIGVKDPAGVACQELRRRLLHNQAVNPDVVYCIARLLLRYLPGIQGEGEDYYEAQALLEEAYETLPDVSHGNRTRREARVSIRLTQFELHRRRGKLLDRLLDRNGDFTLR